jgi:hypothetical protein
MPFVTVSLYQSAQSILTQFSGSLQQRAIQNFKATGVSVVLGVQVSRGWLCACAARCNSGRYSSLLARMHACSADLLLRIWLLRAVTFG